MIFCFILFAIACFLINILIAKGKLKRNIIVFNIVAVGLFLLILLIYGVDTVITKSQQDKYQIYEGEITAGYQYEGVQDGYDVFTSYEYFTTVTYVSPKGIIRVSPICRIYPEVKIFADENGLNSSFDSDGQVILSDGRRAEYTENVVKISPAYVYLVLYGAIGCGVLLAVINIIGTVLVICQKANRRK